MKALVITGKQKMSIKNQNTPIAKKDQVLIEPKYIGICGSDIHYFFNGANGTAVIKEPFIPGHEFSGILKNNEIIKGKKYPAGTKLAVHPAIWGRPLTGMENKREIWPEGNYYGSAANFPHCQGGMRELMPVYKYQIRILPQNVSLKLGSLAEPLAVALHGINLAGEVKGKKVLISGAGPIGLLVAASCVLNGAEVTVSDVLKGPLFRARNLNVKNVINLGNGEKVPSNNFDVIFECSGSAPGITTAFDAINLGGTVVQIGMIANKLSSINLASICTKEVVYKGSLRFDKEFDDAISMLKNYTTVFEKVITHSFNVQNAIEAFKMAKNSEKSGKVVISFE